VRSVDADGPEVRTGVTGRVQTPIGLWLPFEITDVAPGRSWDWRVAGVGATGHRLVVTGPNACRVEFTVPAWGAPYTLVLRSGLRRLKSLAESE
jgi:hypothetical protein